MVGMADGFAQASGRPTHVNLHTAPGVGNAVGGIFNAQANKAPLVITAGQQVRAQITMEANLTNRDATLGPQPYVKWSHEPPRAQDVPGAIARAIHHATLPPRGPAFVSIPMDDWDAEADEDRAAQRDRRVGQRPRGARPGGAARSSPRGSSAARNPVLVAGPGHRRQRRLGRTRSRWPRSSGCRCGPRPATGGGRLGFPENHPQLRRASCRRRSAPSRETLKDHDLVLVVGSSVFPYYPYIPGPLLAEGTAAGGDHQRPRRGRARADGRRDRRRRRAGAAARWSSWSASPSASAPSRARSPAIRRSADPMSGSRGDGGAGRRLAAGRDRRARVAVLDARAAQPAAPLAARAATTSAPAAGSASASRPRSACSSPSPSGRSCACSARARRSTGSPRCGRAVAYKVPVTFLVLRNEEYMILKWFADARAGQRRARARPARASTWPPSPAATAMPAREVDGREELTAALREAIAAEDGPRLVQVHVASGMWLE